jgi:DNA repair exonuclease SbcCD ATPase subunit
MRLIALRVTKFGSFKETVEFKLPAEPGLYFMQGRNEAEPRLEANGSGKSTLWKALTWCLYGKTADGMVAGDLNTWGAGKGTSVEAEFEDDDVGIRHVVTRTWGPISWKLRSWDLSGDHWDFDDTVDLAKAKDNAVIALLRLEFVPWLHSVLMAQEEDLFLDMKADAQAALFSEIMGLDRWLEYSAAASRKATAQDGVSRALERDLAELQGKVATLGRKDLQASVDDWEENRRARLAAVDRKYQDLLEDARELKDKLPGLQAAEEARRAEYRASKAEAQRPRETLEGYLREAAQLEGDLRRALQDLDVVTQRIKDLEDNPACETCGQRLTPDARRAAALKANKEMDRVAGLADRLSKDAKEIAEDVATVRNRLKSLEAAEEADGKALDQAADDYSHARREHQLAERDLDRLEEQAEDIEKERNPYDDMQADVVREGHRLADELADTQARLDASNERYSILSFWVRGFKELRLELIAEALNELEIEVNSCVTDLVGWELCFQVDKETKSGGISKGFNVFVRSPHNEKAVPWKAWSGGEKQRLRVAGNMGLSDLIRSRTAATLNLEVWDEPTKNLSPQGVIDLLESLAARARKERRQIWIVDHRTHAFGDFTGSVTVIKDKRGSYID